MRARLATAVVAAACGVGVVSWNQISARETAPPAEATPATQPATEVELSIESSIEPATQPSTQPAEPVEPKPLSQNVIRGLNWLAAHQLADGGWGQGPESTRMSRGNNPNTQNEGRSNVGDTCMAALALMRSGSTPGQGEFATHIRRAVEFVCDQVEKSDEQSLWVTDIRGTRIQSKLGNYVDTFLAALLLAEAVERMPDADGNARVMAALGKTIAKIERNQRDDGGWANEGWAPVLAQGLASKSVNRAAQNGAPVSEEMRKRAEQYAQANFDRRSGAVAATGAAGVELYAAAANVQSIKDSDDTNILRERDLLGVLASPTTQPEAREQAEQELRGIRQNRQILADATAAVTRRLDDERFVAGFGSNGGEEFLSYMNIGETLVARGGDDWAKWDQSMTENMNRIQNDDGSWSGHHCITGQTFCTAASLMVLMTDRVTTPLAAEIGRK